MTGDDVRSLVFLPKRWGYDAHEIEKLVERIAIDLDAELPLTLGRDLEEWPPKGIARGTGLSPAEVPPKGYDVDAVDWFVEAVRTRNPDLEDSADAWSGPVAAYAKWPLEDERIPFTNAQLRNFLAKDCYNGWLRFPSLPGNRLLWTHKGVGGRELRSLDGRVLARVRRRHERLRFRSEPHIAKSIELVEGGRFTVREVPDEARTSDLLDWDGSALLRLTGVHFDRRARAVIQLADHREIRFPVRGTRRTNALMTAIDEMGNCIARFRAGPGITTERPIEVVIRPGRELTNELILVIAWAAPLLLTYFDPWGRAA